MEKTFDLVIIGSGSAAMSAAFYCSSHGLSTAVVDSKPFGGTCALRGCDPKKVLYGIAESARSVDRNSKHGLSSGTVNLLWKRMVEFKRTFTEPMVKGIEGALENAGITAIHGRASFIGKGKLKVGDDVLNASKILIASGARAADLGIPGQEHMADNETFLDLENLPRRIVFVGGGYISVEFAGIASRAGSETTIIHRGEEVLKNFEPELARRVRENLEKQGVKVLLSHSVKEIRKSGDSYSVAYKSGGGDGAIECDLVVHGSGRTANIEDMDLEKGGVKKDSQGVLVNEYMQSTTNPGVYSAGDSASTPGDKLTPVANIEGEAAGYNIIHGNTRKPDYRGIPTVVFSSPPLARVGLSEKEARESGRKVKINSGDSSGWYNSRRKGLENTGYKLILDEESDEVLGAHILGDNCEESINMLSLAIRYGIPASDLKNYPFAYPSDTTEIRYML